MTIVCKLLQDMIYWGHFIFSLMMTISWIMTFCELLQDMIHIADTKVARRYGDFFIRQIHKFEEVNITVHCSNWYQCLKSAVTMSTFHNEQTLCELIYSL